MHKHPHTHRHTHTHTETHTHTHKWRNSGCSKVFVEAQQAFLANRNNDDPDMRAQPMSVAECLGLNSVLQGLVPLLAYEERKPNTRNSSEVETTLGRL